ncbi:MAG: hypothetical protein HPZ91_15930 [Lentisphaeria bacterium]|nr:hypothetical protein [Lentisphaeria bacterium]
MRRLLCAMLLFAALGLRGEELLVITGVKYDSKKKTLSYRLENRSGKDITFYRYEFFIPVGEKETVRYPVTWIIPDMVSIPKDARSRKTLRLSRVLTKENMKKINKQSEVKIEHEVSFLRFTDGTEYRKPDSE